MASKTEKKQSPLTIFPLLTKLIIVILVVLGGILSFVIYQESILDLQNTLNILGEEGSRLIYQIESYAELMAFLEGHDEGAADALQDKLRELLRNEDHLFYIQLVNSRGERLMDAGESFPISRTCYDHLMFSLANDQAITHTYKDPQSGNIIFEIIEPPEPFNNQVRGKTIGAVRLGLLLDKVRSQISFTRKSHFYNLSTTNVAAGKQRTRIASLIQFTLPGAPTVFYGDEVGMTGDDDPDDRRTFPWPDLGGQPDWQLQQHYRMLSLLRRVSPALTRGDLKVLLSMILRK